MLAIDDERLKPVLRLASSRRFVAEREIEFIKDPLIGAVADDVKVGGENAIAAHDDAGATRPWRRTIAAIAHEDQADCFDNPLAREAS